MGYNPQTEKELTGNLRAAQTTNKKFWETIFTNTNFAEAIKQRYTLAQGSLLPDDISEDTDSEDTESDDEV